MSVLRSGNTPRSSSCAKTDDLPSEGVSRSVFSSRSVTLLQPPEINTSNVQVINSGSRELRVVIDPTNSVTCDQIVGESKLGVDLQSSLRSREAGETCDIRTTQSLSPLSPTNNKYLESVATSSSSSASSSISYSQQQQQRMRLNSSRWTHAEDEKLRQLVQKYVKRITNQNKDYSKYLYALTLRFPSFAPSFLEKDMEPKAGTA